MRYKKTCEFCKKKFLSRSSVKKYCSYECARGMTKQRREENEQPCWRCKNACGGCSWSDNLTPVDGWDATPTIVKDSMGDIESYRIKKCPEFIEE